MRARVRGMDVVDDPGTGTGPVLVRVLAGPDRGADDPSEESFDVDVVTPAGLEALLGPTPMLLGRHFLIVRELDLPAAQAFLRQRFEEPEARSWPELALKLGRIGFWEFEDHQE